LIYLVHLYRKMLRKAYIKSVTANAPIRKIAKRICIIGAGPSGVASCKELLAAGLEPTVFELSDKIGGNWVYREQTQHSSVYQCTHIDNSKHICAFSDFPPPKDFPHYCSHDLILKYINLYANAFGLLRYIKLNTKVLKCVPANGKWKVTVVHENKEREEEFDGLLVCNGHHNVPRFPNFDGADSFTGTVIHSHSYKYPEPFQNKHVVVVGVGNSGVDIASDVSHVSKKLYLSTRSGAAVLPKMIQGKPIDFMVNYFASSLPKSLSFVLARALEKQITGKMEEVSKNLAPKGFTLDRAHPTLSGDLIHRIGHGYVQVKPNIKKIRAESVEFEDGEIVRADAIIYATGYDFELPFLSGVLKFEDGFNRLYKYMWPTNAKDLPPLAIIGLVQPIGSLFPAIELQARYAALVFSGTFGLPSRDFMEKDVKENERVQREKYIDRPRHKLECDGFVFQESLAELIGCNYDFLSNWKICSYLLFGPLVSYRFRLQGRDKWSGATQAIIDANTVFPN